MKIRFVIAVAIALLGICAFWIRGTSKQLYVDRYVTIGEIRKLGDGFLAHYSRPRFIKIFGGKFFGILGEFPCYLKERGTIVFITRNVDDTIFHVANLDSQTVISINGGRVSFGSCIGNSYGRSEKCSDWIEYSDSRKVILGSRSIYPRVTLFTLNLETKGVEISELALSDYLKTQN